MDILIKSLILLGLRVPLLDEQAIENPTYIAIVKPPCPAENPFLGKVQSFRDRTAGGIFFRAGDLNFLQLMLLERMVYHRSTRLGYYAFSLNRGIDPIAQFDSAHQEDDQRLRASIQEVREAEALYGYRVSSKRWYVQGGSVNQKRVWRIMLQAHLTCRRETANRAYDRLAPYPIWVYPNLVKGLQVEAPNRLTGRRSDLRSVTGRLRDLAGLLDVYSRTCIGWSLSRRMDAQLPLQALEMALAQRDSPSRVDSSL